MSTMTALPHGLRHRILALARRIRLLRALRGASLLLVVLVLTASAAFISDYCLGLPVAMRFVCLVAWTVVGAALTFLALFLPLCRPLSPQALAGLIEERHPELGERLTSAVELAGNPGKHHGSPALVALLIEETETHTGRLNFLDAAPAGSALRLAAVAAVLFLAAGCFAFLWPRNSIELGRRFLVPWRTPGALVFYSLKVAPGTITTANGRPLTVSVIFVPEQEKVSLPESSTLVMIDADGKSVRRDMAAEGPDAYSLQLDQVIGNFAYRIEAGEAVSDTYQVTAVDPVDLAADSPTITISPPAYARSSVEEQKIHGLADLTALQHSRVRFDFQFTRPAATASLEWPMKDAETQSEARAVHPLMLTADHRSASCELPAWIGGNYKLLLEEEHGIFTEFEPRLLAVKVDQPPAFLKVVIIDKFQTDSIQNQNLAREPATQGSRQEDTRQALPYDSVPVDLALADDVGVGQAELEYRINEGTSQCEPIPLQDAGSREARGQFLFKLATKGLQEGDTLHYRIRATDNRNVPEAGLGPNTIYSPSDEHWLTLKFSGKAQPLRQQEVAAEKDDIERRLRELTDSLLEEQRSLNRFRPQARQQPVLNEKQAKELNRLREQIQTAGKTLRELADVLAAIRPLQSLAERAREIVDQQVRRGEEALQQAEKLEQPAARDRRLLDSDKEISAALRRIEELRRAHEQLAQARLDLLKLDLLSDRQEQLAERTAPQSAREPANQDDAPGLERDQKEIAKDLQRLTEQSKPVRKALEATRAEQGRRLAARARELAQAERDLVEAARETPQPEKTARRTELARKQEELAERASQFAKKTRAAAEAARTRPLQTDAARRAAKALSEDNAGEALELQQQNRAELERLAKDLDQASDRAREPREAARQLARLQESLRQKLNEQGPKDRRNLDKGLEDFRREQKALGRAAEDLPMPAQDKAARKQQREAVERAAQALDALEDHDARHAEARMAQAAEALERLADQLPAGNQPQVQEEPAAIPPPKARGQAPEPAAAPQGLPSHEQARQARELAQQQSELSEAVQQLTSQKPQANSNTSENPVSVLAREQAEVAREAAQTARDISQEQGLQASPTQQAEQAAQAAQQTTRHLHAGAIRSAHQAGTRTAEAFGQLVRQLSEPSRSPNAKGPDTLQQARRLSERQADLTRRMEALAADSSAQQAQQQNRQQELQQQTSELNQDLNQLAQQLGASPLARLSAQRAADAGHYSQAYMQQAEESDRQGDQGQAQQAQQQAAHALDQAAKQAEMAARQMTAAFDLPPKESEPGESGAPPGQALQQAQSAMGQAQAQLGQGNQQAAREAMQRASQGLQQAARQLTRQSGQRSPGGQMGGLGAGEAGIPDPSLLGGDAKQYAGKRWGDLPGELRTKIIQDMQAKYGDDYARIIKFYFEQIADTSK
jgi:hypothetical protein